jgi:hypothetical protein
LPPVLLDGEAVRAEDTYSAQIRMCCGEQASCFAKTPECQGKRGFRVEKGIPIAIFRYRWIVW